MPTRIVLKVVTPLLLVLLLAGCPNNSQGSSLETRTLTYDANPPAGHSVVGSVPSGRTYAAGARVAVADNTLATEEGGVGTGWNTRADGTGKAYAGGETLTLDTDLTLYATWALPQRILDSAAAVEAIGQLQDSDSVDIVITGSVDFQALKDALTSTKGQVGLDLTEAESVTTIGDRAFQDATGLVSVILPNTVTSIGANAFANSGLRTLVLEGGAAPISINSSAFSQSVTIYVPADQVSAYQKKFAGVSNATFVSSQVTVTVNWTGAGTSGFQTTYTGDIGTATDIPREPQRDNSSFTFVKWVDDSGSPVSLPLVFKENQTIEANATFVNAAGYPVYPAYLTVQRTSYSAAENDDVGQEKPSWAGGDKPYSVQIADRPKTEPIYDAFTFDGKSQQPKQQKLEVTTGDATTVGTFRIPALNKLVKPDGTARLFAAADIRYRGRAEGNGDCGDTTAGGSDFLIAYSDDGGATWTRKVIDVPNSFDEKGQSQSSTFKTDLGDPQLWTVGNTIYVGGVTGTAIIKRSGNRNSGLRVFKSEDYGETWVEDTDVSKGRDTYAFLWNDINQSLIQAAQNGYANLPCPGHGIVLTQEVPGTDITKGMTVVPMQGGSTTFKAYFAYGAGEPSTWNKKGSQAIDISAGQGEWQICQLDDGSLLGVGKKGSTTAISIARYAFNTWTEISSDAWIGRGASQSSVLKVTDGNGTDKYGVVAFTSPKSKGAKTSADQTDDKGRDRVTVSFGRDISTSTSSATSPIDSERYYVQIRKMGQRFFGYTDMVMIDDETIGIIYECFDNANNDIDGLRFIAIDVSEVVKKLSTK